MGRHGPPKTPLKILKNRKSWRGKKNASPPEPIDKKPPCPAWLTLNAKRHWMSIAGQLRKMGVLTLVDGDALANYCQAWARWRQAEESITKHGMLLDVLDGDGVRRLEKPFGEFVAILGRLQREFGLTPSARASLTIEKPKTGTDGKERFFKATSG